MLHGINYGILRATQLINQGARNNIATVFYTASVFEAYRMGRKCKSMINSFVS